MQTRVCRLYAKGDVRVETEEVAAPGPGEVRVAIAAGGICGSDLHYFQDGGFGPIRVREPIILGHEIAGAVLDVGEGVSGLVPGDRVAVNPSRPCGACRYCRSGMSNHCLEMRFYGSAMRLPHEQGGFRDVLRAPAAQCLKLADDVSFAAGACAEPLAVCLHARNRAGSIAGAAALITGAGPIGALMAAVARHAGAARIVVIDLEDTPLAAAAMLGATDIFNVRKLPDALAPFEADKGQFDVAFECTAAPPALASAIRSVRPRGTIVQVGVTGEIPVPINAIVGKEIALTGTHRFMDEYAEAVALLNAGRIDPSPIITRTVPLAQAAEAFAVAGDRRQSVKVQLGFGA